VRPVSSSALCAAIAGLVLAAGVAVPLSGQSSGNPLSACFNVRLIQPSADGGGDGRTILSSEVVEFIFEPGRAWSQGMPRTWRLEHPPRADEVAIWWPDRGDRLVAVWMRGGEPLTLRLQASGNRLLGLARDSFSGGAQREVDAVRTTCPGPSRPPGRR
jgi:hypothetical protein